MQKLIQRVRPLGGAVHLIGMVSAGSAAGSQHHLAVLAAMLSHEGLQVWVHGVMDGIDARPQEGIICRSEFIDDIAGAEHEHIRSPMGRTYAFDEGNDQKLDKHAWKTLVEDDRSNTRGE